MTTIVDDTSSLLEVALALALVSSGEVGGVAVETVDDDTVVVAIVIMRAMSSLARAGEYMAADLEEAEEEAGKDAL